MRYEHVFGDVRPFAQCHAATLVRAHNNRLLVAWFGGTYEGHPDSAIFLSERNNQSSPDRTDGQPGASRWSRPRRIAKVGHTAHWNPVLFSLTTKNEQGASRLLVLHFKVGAKIRRWETWQSVSTDDGNTWSKPAPLDTRPSTDVRPGDLVGARNRGAVKNKPIRLASGDWLAGSSIEVPGRWDAFLDRSPNGIDAWSAHPPIKIDRSKIKGKGIIQPTLWTSSETSVHALFRSTEGVLYRADSEDCGQTWSAARPTRFGNNNSGIDCTRFGRDGLALACNPVATNWGARTPLTIFFSPDNGETWPERFEIETDPGEYSYPALIEDGGGLALAYTWNRRRIAVARLSGPEIPDY